MMNWENNNKRFVAFFDILGFKDMVTRFKHKEILKKLEMLKSTAQQLENYEWKEFAIIETGLIINKYQTRSITFSDSILFFSNGDTIEDFLKIVIDSWVLLEGAIKNNIVIRGAISFGEITVDFRKSLFFGQPIIDSHLLHEDINMLGIILDHNAENQKNTFKKNSFIQKMLNFQKVKMKYGNVSHTLITVTVDKLISEVISSLEELYKVTSGKPRLYIDNTIDYYNELKKIKAANK